MGNSQIRPSGNVTLPQLLALTVKPVLNWFRRQAIKAHIRSLQRLADYFAWQETNGREGLADTHKRMALATSELNALK